MTLNCIKVRRTFNVLLQCAVVASSTVRVLSTQCTKKKVRNAHAEDLPLSEGPKKTRFFETRVGNRHRNSRLLIGQELLFHPLGTKTMALQRSSVACLTLY